MKPTTILMLVAALLPGALPRSASGEEAKQREFFEARIRPVLIKHCYECHSSETEEPKGNLRVDSAAALLRGGDSGPAVVAGKPDESPLIEALRYDGLEMPPAGRLPQNVVQDFVRWVETGAWDPRTEVAEETPAPARPSIDVEAGRAYWAFQPVRRHATPPVTQADWPRTEIDAFLLHKLEAAGLQPAPDADRRTLIRRLYFDLTGLPPSPGDVDAFLEDDSPDAWQNLVDRLLQSSQFGVHWGRHWLDVARYADSNGGDFNATFHNAWKYRDYVFRAFNQDKPFDQFVRQQIAGDLLPAASDAERSEQIIATGFLMLGAKMLSERDKLKLTMDVVDEQINTVGQAFMGLTIGCARCHDHKFDPIPTRDYYALAGIFRSTRTLQGESQQYVSTWPRRELPTSEAHLAALETYNRSKQELQARIKETETRRDQLAKRIEKLRSGEQAVTVDDTEARLTGNWKPSTYSPNYVGKGYIHDDQAGKGEKFAEFTVRVPEDADYDVQLSYTPGSGRANNVPIRIQHAGGESEVMLNQQEKPPIADLFKSVGRFAFASGQPGVVTIGNEGTSGHVIVDAVRLVQLDAEGRPVKREPGPQDEMLAAAEADMASTAAELKQLQQRLAELEKNAPAPLPRAIAVAEAEEIGDCHICIRGEHENLGAQVPRGVLEVATGDAAPEFPEKQSGRLELANWLADGNHPLTARVFVNRVWQHLFGQGIVASVDNFGKLGTRPSHPELLDRLAADFMNDGWSTKRLIRRIVLSRAYQMSSRHDEASWNADPENRLLWRANRRRLPAESIRDAMLAVSGQLDLSPGGSPVEGLGTLVTQNTADPGQYEREESLRRSAYLPIIRSEIPEMLLVFDFADPDLVTGRRPVTNVPAQALLLLNSPFVMARAERAAERVEALSEGDEDVRGRIVRTYEIVLSRVPSEAEIERAEAFLQAAGRSDAALPPLAQLIHTLFASTEFRMLN